MRKLIPLTPFFLIAGAFQYLHAQSVRNTAWKAFLESVRDTVTLHIKTDSSYATNSVGDVLVRSSFKIVKDTLTIRDVDGRYVCPDADGIYKITVDRDNLIFGLINDPCDGRSNAISSIKWIKVPESH